MQMQVRPTCPQRKWKEVPLLVDVLSFTCNCGQKQSKPCFLAEGERDYREKGKKNLSRHITFGANIKQLDIMLSKATFDYVSMKIFENHFYGAGIY